MSCNLASSISYDVLVQLLDTSIFRYQSVLKVMTVSKAVINSLMTIMNKLLVIIKHYIGAVLFF